ncbi:MAG: magnesium transporter CorA family protein [Candidatus Wildermuthbacteria bacterium]|nr:magnesium transporter CorA family protein [Candidatus Wildermuthbacteria bacterium]
MLTIYYKTVKEQKIQVLDAFRTGSWVVAENPGQEELDFLAKNLSLNRTLLGDAVDPHEVPRVEREGEVTYVFTRVPLQEDMHTTTTPVMIAVGKTFVLSVSRHPLPFLKKFQDGSVDFNTTQKTKLFLQIFSEINTMYSSFINSIARGVRGVTVRLEGISNKEIKQFVLFESSLNDFLAALVPTNTLLGNLLSGKFLQLYEQDHELVEDLTLSNRQLIELCQSNMRNIGNIREGYSTIMTNNLNRIIKVLTALTIVLTIPMIFASFYGMNVRLPLADSPQAFFLVLGTTVGVSIGVLALFMKNRWL